VVTLRFPPELPISARVEDLTRAIEQHPVVIVAGATGSGKTTQLPKIALAMGRGRERGLIGVTQPRRIAATSVAARVASELGTPLGQDVGYQVRFDDRTGKNTAIKFMTDGILLAEIQGDRRLRRYDTLIIDEAHERSLTIDFLLGWIARILPERPDLKVIISSATIETERFSEFFGGAPVVQVEGRTYPVDVLYEPPAEDDDLPAAVARAVSTVTSLDPHGDVLVFLPGEREIKECEGELQRLDLRHTSIQPLYGRLAAADQGKVFSPINQRRVVLATNVAETSVTIPGIVYVIDTGVARLSRYDPRSGTTRLQIEAISQASADQRKGRCGRVREGICIRLYDEPSFLARSAFTDPEIKRTGLAGVILRMKSLELGDVDQFPFLDPPHPRAITEGYRVLEELGALDEERRLTPLGRRLARFPVDPRIGRMILAGAELGCLADVLVVTAALNTQDPRERPRDAQQQADEVHRRFRDERSDFLGLLKLWAFVQEQKGSSALRRACKANFLSFMRVREWIEVHRQLLDIVRELKLDGRPQRAQTDEVDLHRALLTGLLSKVGQWSPEKRVYLGAKATLFMVHPSSALAKKPPAWVMAFELVETSQLFARTAAKILPEWLIDAAPHLVKRSYGEPHWSERTARATVKETVTLYGLTLARDRSVDLAPIDAVRARLMFIEHALVRGEYKSKGTFQATNQALLEDVQRLRDKARQSDMMADDAALIAFFEARLPADVVSGKVFEAWREQAERKDPRLLLLSPEDVLTGERALVPADYPDSLVLHGTTVAVSYKFDHTADDDGVTLTLPLLLLPQLDPGELHWMIRGWHRQKLEALLDELPKATRRTLGNLAEVAAQLAARLAPFEGPLVPVVARELSRLLGIDVAEELFRPHAVPHFLRLYLRIVDDKGKLVAEGRDVDTLLAQHGKAARAVWKTTAAPSAWEQRGLTTWSFGELPTFVTRSVGPLEVRSYPALVDQGTAVDLVLLEAAAEAEEATRLGVRRLLMLRAKGALSTIVPKLPAPLTKASGAPPAKDEDKLVRATLLARVVDETFGLAPGSVLPRTPAAFEALATEGTPRLYDTFVRLQALLEPIRVELDKTLRALKTASQQPSGKAAVVDLRQQLEHLVPLDLLAHVPLAVLPHYPRYLRAAQTRLTRAIADPRKDTDKLAPLAPLWTAFLTKRKSVRDRRAAEDLRWLFEELRVSIFAPELKTPVPVSVAKVSAALADLR
jgi:ATP-dependent helicase HrpA